MTTQEYKPGQMLKFAARDGRTHDAEFRGWFQSRTTFEKLACIILRTPGECPVQMECKPGQLSL